VGKIQGGGGKNFSQTREQGWKDDSKSLEENAIGEGSRELGLGILSVGIGKLC